MRERANITEVLEMKPDFMGFIFYPLSPRYVGDDFIIPEDMPLSTKKVGVFVNERNDIILKKVGKHRLDFVQLHGDETPAQCKELRDKGVGVIKFFPVDDETDFGITTPYKDAVDYFLFDTRGRFYGGNARRFNWNVLSRYDQKIPFFLSGGITPENAGEVSTLENYNLFAIDVNSGVETRPGHKDRNKINAIKALLKK